jgi:serine/threonine protein kinase/tetratricopeptide (TPR) repeat protein
MSPHSADRNLLIGMIALQMDFISRDQLIEAMNAWVLNKATALSQILVDQGALSASRRSLLNALVEEHVKLHDDDPQNSLAALRSTGSLRDELSLIADADLQAALPHVSAAWAREKPEADLSGTQSAGVGESTSAGLRFRILRPHAKGGLGRVSVALDTELDRTVALKEIQDAYADDQISRARFVQEAEITGKLEHPGIVPVYGLGHYADGRPFYAMRFVQGDTLKEAIARFHGEPGRGSAGSHSPIDGEPGHESVDSTSTVHPESPSTANPDGLSTRRSQSGRAPSVSVPRARARRMRSADAALLEFRQLLRRFTDVCNAIAYAHSRGVIHRDLKPGNVMLGPFGETLVVDWGLAKPMGEAYGSVEHRLVAESYVPIRLSAPSGSGHETLPGKPVGTPAFMSPEQAQGQLDRLGPRSDVYGLGAMLYCLLTGRAPFEGNDLGTILRAVQNGEFLPPSNLGPSVDPALDAVCQKAMALKPEDRYATARDLGRDVERWLAGEPVTAWREPLSVQARRWMRRHRTLVATAATVLVVAAAAAIVVASQQAAHAGVIRSKNTQLTIANTALEVQRRNAEERAQMAIEAVKRFREVVVAEPALTSNPDLRPLRNKLLKEPLAFFHSLREELQADQTSRPEALSRLADAISELAHLTEQIGDKQDALRSHQDSLTIFERLAHEHPGVDEFQRRLAQSHSDIGNLERATGQPDRALESHAKALAIRERLVQLHPGVIEFHSALATSHNNIGISQNEAGHPDQALESHGKALEIRQRLVREHPTESAFRNDLAVSYNNLGNLQYETGHSEQALQCYATSVSIKARLARENPGVTQFQSALAATHNNIAVVENDMGHPEKALESHRKALAILDRLARENPAVVKFQNDLAASHSNIGVLQKKTGHLEQALESYGKALAIRERLARENPSVTAYQLDLASSYSNVGLLRSAAGHPDSALESHGKAFEIEGRLAREYRDSPDYASAVGASLHNMANIDLDAKRFQSARDKLRQAISWEKKALTANPRHPTYRRYMVSHLTDLVRAAKALGDTGEAAAAQRELAELEATDHPDRAR